MNKKVIFGMSGGVDSGVGALLLKRQGFDVISYFMNCCVHAEAILFSTMEWKNDERILREICRKLGLELIMAKCGLGYEKKIIGPMINFYFRFYITSSDKSSSENT